MKVLFFILVAVSVILGVYQVHVISSIPASLGTEVKEVVPERMSDVHPSGNLSAAPQSGSSEKERRLRYPKPPFFLRKQRRYQSSTRSIPPS